MACSGSICVLQLVNDMLQLNGSMTINSMREIGREPESGRAPASLSGVGAGVHMEGATLPHEGPGEGDGCWV